MTNDDVLVEHLRVLARQDSWRIPELPESITDDVLRVLDKLGWLEFALWQLRSVRQNTELFPDGFEPRRDESTGWFSPSGWLLPRRGQSGRASFHREQSEQDLTLTTILAEGRRRPKEAPEVRVSEIGKAALAEWKLQRVSKPSKPPKPKTKRRKREPRTTPTITMMKAHKLHQAGSTLRDIAKAIGVKSPATVSEYVRIVKDWEKKQRSVKAQALPTGKSGNLMI